LSLVLLSLDCFRLNAAASTLVQIQLMLLFLVLVQGIWLGLTIL